MTFGNFDNNVLGVLAYVSTQATWVAATTISRECHIEYDTVRWYLNEDTLGQVAYHFRYDYRIRRRKHVGPGHGHTLYLSATSRGYGT